MSSLRHQQIVSLLNQSGMMTVADLCKHLGVSVATVRRDLNELEQQQRIRRINGGAMLPKPQTSLPAAETGRSIPYYQEKRAIAEAAAALIRPGDTIFIDSGSTNDQLALLLTEFTDITVITNSLHIAYQLYCSHQRISIFVCGGTIGSTMHPNAGIVGPLAEKLISQFKANIAFIGTSGIDRRHGLTAFYLQAASIKNMMLENCSRAVLLADHSKFGQVHSAYVGPLTSIDHVITDRQAPEEDISYLRSLDLEVTLV